MTANLTAERLLDEAIDALVKIREAIHAASIVVSDRRWKKAVKYLRARAAIAQVRARTGGCGT